MNIDEKDIDIRMNVIRQIFTIQKTLISNAIKAMEKDNLSKTEITILFMVKRKPYKATDLAKEIGISASTLTGVVDRLVERGYVKRIRDEKDRRVVFIVPGDLVLEKAKLAHDKILNIMKSSDVLMPEEWWIDMSEKLKTLGTIFEEKGKEVRELEDEK